MLIIHIYKLKFKEELIIQVHTVKKQSRMISNLGHSDF